MFEKNMEIVELYFVSGDVVNGILRKDEKISAKGMAYTMVKPSTLRNIILDRPFRRDKKKILSSADYYGFERKDYSVKDSGFLQYFLNSEKERPVVDFLESRF